MSLTDQANKAAAKWCVCDPAYKDRERVDPTCRCDCMAEMAEDFARQFAEKALREAFKLETGDPYARMLTTAAIDAAGKD